MGSLRDEMTKIYKQQKRLTAEIVVEAATPASHRYTIV